MSYKVTERIFKLKQGIEQTTGETYNDLTEAVQGLKDGYKQGEATPEEIQKHYFPEDTTGLPNVSVDIGGATYTYYRVADFVSLEKMETAKLFYNYEGEKEESVFEIGASSPTGSYSDSSFRVVSVVEDNETLPFEMLGIEVTFPKAGTYFIYSADMGGALILEIIFPDEVIALLEGTIEEITIPNEVTKLRTGGFVGCNSLKEINADESHEVYTSADGILYTKDGKKLVSYPPAKEETEYIMPDSVEEVESMAFNGTTNLENVKLSDNIKSLPKNLGIENENADVSLVLNPEYLSTYSEYPVSSKLIKTVTIPEGSTYLSATVFDTLPNIENLYYNSECELEQVGISDGKSTHYLNGIAKLQNLKKLEIGGSVKTIPDDFSGKYGGKLRSTLETLIIGDNVETIGQNAFYGLDQALKELIIGNNVKSIGAYAFYDINDLEGTLIIPDSVVELGTYEDSWGVYCNTFCRMSKISKVVIGKGLTELGRSMFAYCTSLAEVAIPSNIKAIRYSAFSGCTSLLNITISEGVEAIEERAFEDCSSLTDVVIPDSVTTIGIMIFCGCTSLANITLPNGITIIPNSMFLGCTNLTNVTIPNSVEVIDNNAFMNCVNLANITIPKSVTSIGIDAFMSAGANVEGGLTIHGYAGSYAETFATENSINFEVIEE